MSDGQWEATLIVSNGCHSDTIDLTLLILTGVNEPVDDDKMLISPNPSPGHFRITVKDNTLQSSFQLEMFDANGRSVYKKDNVVPVNHWMHAIWNQVYIPY
jgi:hypothetical protein